MLYFHCRDQYRFDVNLGLKDKVWDLMEKFKVGLEDLDLEHTLKGNSIDPHLKKERTKKILVPPLQPRIVETKCLNQRKLDFCMHHHPPRKMVESGNVSQRDFDIDLLR